MLSACEEKGHQQQGGNPFSLTGTIRSTALDEISGIQAGAGADWYVHNDEDKTEIYVIDLQGNLLATVHFGQPGDPKLQDPEGLVALPGAEGPVLALADMGDNHQPRESIRLLMMPFPAPDAAGFYPTRVELLHSIILHYPDGSRDCESIAYDAASGQVLFLTKRDKPPRLYGLDAESAMREKEMTLEFLGEVPGFRPPTPIDLLREPDRGAWISQPTGMDISADGRLAAVITYRSLYLFSRDGDESWAQAFREKPLEFRGPPGSYEEAVGFSPDQDSVIVTTERLPAPMYRFDLNSNLARPPAHASATDP
jgi:hypothetical protein